MTAVSKQIKQVMQKQRLKMLYIEELLPLENMPMVATRKYPSSCISLKSLTWSIELKFGWGRHPITGRDIICAINCI